MSHSFSFCNFSNPLTPHSFPTRRSSDLCTLIVHRVRHFQHVFHDDAAGDAHVVRVRAVVEQQVVAKIFLATARSEEHTSELQSLRHLVCRLLLEKKKRYTWCKYI